MHFGIIAALGASPLPNGEVTVVVVTIVIALKMAETGF
jgi:hypothetical protein